MPFNDSDKELLNKFIKIWKKINNLVGKECDTELFMVIMINT